MGKIHLQARVLRVRLVFRSLLSLGLVFSSAILSGSSIEAAAPRKPNVVFVLADDLGYAELGCFGQQKIHTPNLDRLAAEGMRFTQHYAGSAVCAPSRCVLMTGKHSGHAFIRDNKAWQEEGQHPIPADTVTLARLLQQQGYATGGFGKWGLGGPGSTGEPLRQGFDRFFGYNCQAHAHNFYPTYLWDDDRRVPLDNPKITIPQKLPDGADPNDPASYRAYTGPTYSADLIMEQAREFIRRNKERPFFLYIPSTIPHLALQVPEDSLAAYLGQWEDPPYVGGNGYLPNLAPRAAYAAMVTRLDREVGKIMDLIRELGLDEDTIFVFTSDNGPVYDRVGGTDSDFFESTRVWPELVRGTGPPQGGGGSSKERNEVDPATASERRLRGFKGSLYEGGVRVPMILRWEGRIAPGGTSDRVTGFEDWMPTLLELIGARDAVPGDIDGISFVPTALGQRQEPRPFLYREFPGYGGQQSVRLGDWKGVRQNLIPRGKNQPAPRQAIELYDLQPDVGETTDVSANHPEIVERIRLLMDSQHTPSELFPIPILDAR